MNEKENPQSTPPIPQDDTSNPDNTSEVPAEEPDMKPGWYRLNDAKYYPDGLDGKAMGDLGPGTITIFKDGGNSVDNFIEGTHKGMPLKKWRRYSFEDDVLTLGPEAEDPNQKKRLVAKAGWYQNPPF